MKEFSALPYDLARFDNYQISFKNNLAYYGDSNIDDKPVQLAYEPVCDQFVLTIFRFVLQNWSN